MTSVNLLQRLDLDGESGLRGASAQSLVQEEIRVGAESMGAVLPRLIVKTVTMCLVPVRRCINLLCQ